MKQPVWKVLLLYPISLLYAFVVGFRNKLFDLDILRSKEYGFPIISVGNITVGGTGKTPHTEYLISLLGSSGLRLAMLSRGYKRKTRGFFLADYQSNARTIGDEPYQIYRKFPNILVAVDSDRRRGIQCLRKLEDPPQVILLDDAFQHRYVTPGISILLIDYHRLIYKDSLLPLGRLRESAGERDRADIIVVTKCPKAMKPIDARIIEKNLTLTPSQSLYFSTYAYEEIYPVFETGGEWTKTTLRKSAAQVLVVTGIVSAHDLYAHVWRTIGKFETLEFPDHHYFSEEDWRKVKKRFAAMPCETKIILVSEKDASRLLCDKLFPDELKPYVYAIPLKVVFLGDKQTMFNKQINDYVRENKRIGRFS